MTKKKAKNIYTIPIMEWATLDVEAASLAAALKKAAAMRGKHPVTGNCFDIDTDNVEQHTYDNGKEYRSPEVQKIISKLDVGRKAPREDLLNLQEFVSFARKMKLEKKILEAFDLSDEAWEETLKKLKMAT